LRTLYVGVYTFKLREKRENENDVVYVMI